MPRSVAIADCCWHACDTLCDSRKEGSSASRSSGPVEGRVVRAAETALAHQQYVSAIDIITGAGLLAPTHVESWRKGRIDFLERVIQANLKKISLSMAMFRQWALAHGLKPSETRYVRHAHRDGGPPIQQERRSRHREELLHSLCLACSVRAQTTADQRKAESLRPARGIQNCARLRVLGVRRRACAGLLSLYGSGATTVPAVRAPPGRS